MTVLRLDISRMVDEPGIYLITCTATTESYVGSARSLYRRCLQHARLLSLHADACRKLQRAYDKFGPLAFTADVLELCDETNLPTRETYWIRQLNPVFNKQRKGAPRIPRIAPDGMPLPPRVVSHNPAPVVHKFARSYGEMVLRRRQIAESLQSGLSARQVAQMFRVTENCVRVAGHYFDVPATATFRRNRPRRFAEELF